jgi:hypothetical protein
MYVCAEFILSADCYGEHFLKLVWTFVKETLFTKAGNFSSSWATVIFEKINPSAMVILWIVTPIFRWLPTFRRGILPPSSTLYEILGFHGGEDDDVVLLGFGAV